MANRTPKPPKPTVYAKNTGKGISSLIDSSEGRNFLTDAARTGANFGSSALSFLGSQDQPKYGLGDQLFGMAPRLGAGTGVGRSSGGSFGGKVPAPADPTAPAEAAPIAKTLADYMAQAKSMGLGGGDGTNYDGLINQIKANGQSGDAKLAAMYNALANSNAGEATGIKTNFDTTGSKIAAASDAASKDTAQAYDSTRAAQTQQLNDLGIQGAASVLAANGSQSARDQNIALSNIASGKATNLNQNTAHGANAQQYNTGVVESNRAAGVQARSGLQQQLATKLAELEQAKAQAQTGGAAQAFSAALQLQSQDPTNPLNIAKYQQLATTNDLNNQKTASQIALNQFKASGGSAKTLQSALNLGAGSKQYQQIVKLAANNGINTSDQKAMGSFITNLMNSAKLG
jgi:hypothetical protein